LAKLDQYLPFLKPRLLKSSRSASWQEVSAFEERFRFTLPNDYRDFLLNYGSRGVRARCPLQEPSPLGTSVSVLELNGLTNDEHDTSDIRWWTKVVVGEGLAVPVASDRKGGAVYLICSGQERECVFYRDPQQRNHWSDEVFSRSLPRRNPAIEHWLDLRRQGALPKKKAPNWYLLASSFTEFMELCASAPSWLF